jgi:phenylpropionate dioxygenase-like ring-hydroxylating dioxygenase large terminal subunit
MEARFPTQREVETAFRRAWFPVARSEDLAAPREARLLGQELVVFRTESGEVGVMDRHCPHRGANLAQGRVVGEALECPYHGWQWAAFDGKCVRIPSLSDGGRIPARALTHRYRVAERWGLVWSCLEEPVCELPMFQELDDLEIETRLGEPMPLECGIVAATENFRDVAHFPFVHRGTMGEIAEEVEPLNVRHEHLETWVTRTYTARGGSREVWGSSSVVMNYHAVAPACVLVRYDDADHGQRVILHAPCPTSAESCIVFFGVGNDRAFSGPSVEECLVAETEVYLEDKPVVDTLYPGEVDLAARGELSTLADRYTLAYRQTVLNFVKMALNQASGDGSTPEEVVTGIVS